MITVSKNQKVVLIHKKSSATRRAKCWKFLLVEMEFVVHQVKLL